MKHDNLKYKIVGLTENDLPEIINAKQVFQSNKIEKLDSHLIDELNKIKADEYSGKRIAITCGSRKIESIDKILKAVVDRLKQVGAEPVIIPSMGSHGNGDAEGQVKLLKGYGITEQSMGCEIDSSMEVISLGKTVSDIEVYFDKKASECDGIIVMNRIKPHTDFKGNWESGLLKMMVIGLGNHLGAVTLHADGFQNMHKNLIEAATIILKKCKIVAGIALTENPYHKIMGVDYIDSDNIIAREKELLLRVKSIFPSLLMPKIDLLIVDEIGKDISGGGMDPNIIGKNGSGISEGFTSPQISRIAVLGLTKATKGNAIGIGLADFTTKECAEIIDWSALYTNALTAAVPDAAKMPIVMNSDKDMILAALRTVPGLKIEEARIVRIKNSLELTNIEVSVQVLKDMKDRKDFISISKPYKWDFDKNGKLTAPA